jgi:uncharacterized protein YjiS (DUF1127 family)
MQISDPSYAGMTGSTAPALCAEMDAGQQPAFPPQQRFLLRVLARLAGWYQHHRELGKTRRDLACFDDFMLKDIGLSRADAEEQISKGFWRC